MPDTFQNTLYYGDNLEILQRHIKDETVDLIYLDPPFNSNQTYNVLFKEKNGSESAAQIKAFEDSWHWDISAASSFHDIITSGGKTADVLIALEKLVGRNDVLAYLSMMAPRLKELHRVLKPTGSIYLHCDPTASHYLKLLMDAVFGARQFRNEIVWCYETAGKSKKQFSKKHDVIFFYSMGAEWTFNFREVSIPRKRGKHMKVGMDKNGREYEEKKDKRTGKVYRWYFDEGRLPLDYWTDIPFINREEAQRLGYPTQKPEALLERIIKAGSNEGDIVLDPFCGCGTTISVAQRLNRKWIGIDITPLAISLIKNRLKQFGDEIKFEVVGEPKDLSSAIKLATENRYHFQYWALGQVGARPSSKNEEKKGADKGIDGKLNFCSDGTLKGKTEQIIFSVKSGHVHSNYISELVGVVKREKAAIGVFITLEKPTRPMREEAASAGFYQSQELGAKKYPKIQILTIEDILSGRKVDCPQFALGEGNVTLIKVPEYKAFKKRAQHAKLDQF